MTGRLGDEEYWHYSKPKAFNFGDDEFGSQFSDSVGKGVDDDYSTDSLSGSLFRATLSDSSKTTSSLHTLISKKNLSRILEVGNFHEKEPRGESSPEEEVRILRRQVESRWVCPPANDTIIKIVLGHPYSLELYRSLKSKTELLDAAIAVGDGNAILAIVLFLVRTLKKSYIYQLLRTRPHAVTQYSQYLSTRLQVNELTDLLEMLGENREAAMKQFQLTVCCTQNPQRRLHKLQLSLKNHFSLPDNRDQPLIEKYIKLLEWQLSVAGTSAEVAKVLLGKSVLSSLAYTCEHHWGESKGNISSPLTLCQQQGVSDLQFQWTVLTVRARLHSWDDIEGVLITKKLLGGKKLKAELPVEKVIMQLHAHGAPGDVLVMYLELIDNVDRRITLAEKVQCHKAVVNVFVAKRDRLALISYKANLQPQSGDYFYAENALRVSTTKWKN